MGVLPRTVILQKLLNQVYVCEDHTATAVPLQLKLRHSITTSISPIIYRLCSLSTYPSCIVSSSLRYAAHLSPTTLPHEKHRTGII